MDQRSFFGLTEQLDTRINARFSRGVRKIGSGAAGLAAFPAASA
jgi:hypothetical protein